MGSRFRESVFRLLRPHLRIHGDKKTGFWFEAKDGADCEDLWAFMKRGTLLKSWDLKASEADGFKLCGDAELELRLFVSTHASFEHFVADTLLCCHNWFRDADYCRFKFTHIHPKGPQKTWPLLMGNSWDHKGQIAAAQRLRLPKVSHCVEILSDGNTDLYACTCSRGFLMSCFVTS